MDAPNRNAAVAKFKGMMNEGAVKAHMTEKHPGTAIPAVAAVHADIAKMVKEA